LIVKLKSDPGVRIALENLRDEIPDIYKQAIRRQPFFSKAEDGSIITIAFDGNKRKLISHEGEKGSRILELHHGERKFSKELDKVKVSDAEKEVFRNMFSEADINVPITLPTGAIFMKRATGNFQPQLKGPLVDHRLAALIAYEFMALLCGDKIYHQYMNGIRDFIRGGSSSDYFSVERLCGSRYELYHSIHMEPAEKSCQIILRFFHWIVFAIRFERMIYEAQDMVYVEDLKKKRTLIAETRDEAKAGYYYVF